MSEPPSKSRKLQNLPPLPPPPPRPVKNKVNPQEELEKLQKELNALRSGELSKETSTQIESIKKNQEAKLSEYQKKLKARHQRLLEHQHNLQFGDNTLRFRYSLEQNPELVQFIKENLSWLRLAILLYGGLTDDGLATYQTQYDEIASMFQLDDDMRQLYIEKLRQKEYWRDNWDAKGDTVYNLSIYMDKVGEPIIKHVVQARPKFDPIYIFNDSPLSPLLLDALRAKKEPHSLNKHLWQKWFKAADDVVRAHSLIILLLTDTDLAINRLKQALVDAKMEAVVKLVIDHLRKRFHTLKDILILFGTKNKIGEVLKPLEGKIDTNQWLDLVERFYQIYSSVMSRPVANDDVLIDHMSSVPYINTEIWACWLSGLNGDDSPYNFAVVLDTMRTKIASASAMTHLHLAHSTKFDQFVDWHIEPIPPLLNDTSDIVGDALTVAQYSRSKNMAQLFHLGIVGFIGIEYSDYPGLLEDALAATLFLHPKEKEVVLEHLEMPLKDKSLYEATDEIIERTLKIQNHTIRSRAAWRVAQNINTWRTVNLWNTAVEAAEQIEEPLQQSRAFERLINHLPLKQSLRMRAEAERSARNIGDANNRARALARIALSHVEEKRVSLLTEALRTAEQIVEERERLEVVRLIRPYLKDNVELLNKCYDIISHIDDDWCKCKATNLLSTQLLKYHTVLNDAEKLTPIILAIFIDDIINLTPNDEQEQNLWKLILDEDKRQKAIVSLLRIAAINSIQGLELTSEICRILQTLLSKGEISVVHILLPYLRNSNRTLLSQLNDWVETKPDKHLWQYSGLMLAEAGQLDVKTIPCIFDVIEFGVDIGRYRANLVLLGDIVFAGKLDRRYKTSQLGLDTILLLGNKFLETMHQDQHMATMFTWCWYNIFQDDEDIFYSLLEIAEGSSVNNIAAQHILRRINYLDQHMYHAFVASIKNASMTTVKHLLKAWIGLFHNNKPPYVTEPTEYEEIKQLIQNLPSDVLDQFRTIPDRASTIASIVLAVSKGAKEDFGDAITILEEKLADASLGLTTHSIRDIAEHMFYKFNRDPGQAKRAAEQITSSQIGLELLFAWLRQGLSQDLRQDLDRDTSYYYKLDTLLLVGSECAKLAPATVINLISEYKMADDLALAAMHQRLWYGRVGAISLLGYVIQTPHNFATVVLQGLQDLPQIQQATLSMIKNLRYVDLKIVPKVIAMLKQHKDTTVIYSAIQILTLIGRNEKTESNIRKQILKELSTIIKDKYSGRGIFVFEAIGAVRYIRNVGSIDQLAYEAIMDISGVI